LTWGMCLSQWALCHKYKFIHEKYIPS
jgi:hypothetical protein